MSRKKSEYEPANPEINYSRLQTPNSRLNYALVKM